MKKTVYATLGVPLAGFLILWTLGSCPGLMDDPPSPPVPDTTSTPNRTIRLYGTVSEENDQLFLKIPLPQAETARARDVFQDVTSISDGMRVEDKEIIPKGLLLNIVNYYELILRRHEVAPNTHVEDEGEERKVYRQDTALTSQRDYLRIGVKPGDVYDVLILAGYKDAQTKVLLGSAYNDNGGLGFTMEPGANRVELQLYRNPLALSFHSNAWQLAQFIIKTLYNNYESDFQWRHYDYLGNITTFTDPAFANSLGDHLTRLYHALNPGETAFTNWDTPLKNTIRSQGNAAITAYMTVVNSGALEALYDMVMHGEIAWEMRYRSVRGFRFWFKRIGQDLEAIKGKLETLLSSADPTERSVLAAEIRTLIYQGGGDNYNCLLKVLGNKTTSVWSHYVAYDESGNPLACIRDGLTQMSRPAKLAIYHEGTNTPLKVLMGPIPDAALDPIGQPAKRGRDLPVTVTIQGNDTERLGLKPLYTSWRVSDTSPFDSYPSNGFPLAASARFIPRNSLSGDIGIVTIDGGLITNIPGVYPPTPLPATSYYVSSGGLTLNYIFSLPPGDYDGKFVFNLQYYPFGNPFPAGGAGDREEKLQKTRETFGYYPWNIRSGLKHDQEAVYMPSAGPVYSVGGAVRVIAGEGTRDENTYLTVNLLQ